MDTYDAMQDSELEVFGMDGDWGLEKERVYDQLYDIDPVSDLINSSDTVTSPGQPIPMQHSTSLPLGPLPYDSTWAISPLNKPYVHGHSVPEMYDISLHYTDHLGPDWAVPTLQYSSHSSSMSAETYFHAIGDDFPLHGSTSPGPEIENSVFLRPQNVLQHWSSESSVSRPESNASFDITNEDQFEPIVGPFFSNSNQLDSPTLPLVHHQTNRRAKRPAIESGSSKKNSKGRKGPLDPDNRKSTHEMRNVGACQACRDRKTKVHVFGHIRCLPTNTCEVRQRSALSVLHQLLQGRLGR